MIERYYQPVEKGGLLKPGSAKKSWSHPIAALEHLASDLRISRLIRTYQRERAQLVKEERQSKKKNNNHRGDRDIFSLSVLSVFSVVKQSGKPPGIANRYPC